MKRQHAVRPDGMPQVTVAQFVLMLGEAVLIVILVWVAAVFYLTGFGA